MVFYGLPAFSKGNVDVFLMGTACTHRLIKKVSLPYFHLRPLNPSPTPTFLLLPNPILRVETRTLPPRHASSCVTGLRARSRGMPSHLQPRARGPPPMQMLCARRWRRYMRAMQRSWRDFCHARNSAEPATSCGCPLSGLTIVLLR